MKRLSTISTDYAQSGSTNTGGRDAFIFSSNIEDWMASKSLKTNREARQKAPKGPGRITRSDHRKTEDL